MSTQYDVIILGQGLAGTALAWCLRWEGVRVLVVDREERVTSSKVAAGLITPITGQKQTRTWRHAELWHAAQSFYQRVQTEVTARFFQHLPMVRFFADGEEAALFQQRMTDPDFRALVQPEDLSTNGDWFVSNLSGFEMCEGGRLDVNQYLTTSRDCWQRGDSYRRADIDLLHDFEIRPDGVHISRLETQAKSVIFCQGIEALNNPWFSDVRFKPAKGEILTLRIPGLEETRVVHRGVWLAPLGNETFKAGSTYAWNQLDSEPTARGKSEIVSRLKEFLRLPFEVISHEAAVRPIHRNQYPVLGFHPRFSQLGYFNGLGSKGSLHAPFFARQFASCILRGGSIDPAVDLNRKTKWTSNARDSKARPSLAPVEKPSANCPLTGQAQDAIRDLVKVGDTVVDATAGNGHDTQFLASLVGPRGTVYAFDVQKIAVDNTARRLSQTDLHNVVIHHRDHGLMAEWIPREQHGRVAAVMFNLGYLPGGDKQVTTKADSTEHAILQASQLLRPDGMLTILAYTGHDGGASEADRVDNLLIKLPSVDFEVTTIESHPGRTAGPRLFIVKRRSRIVPPN